MTARETPTWSTNSPLPCYAEVAGFLVSLPDGFTLSPDTIRDFALQLIAEEGAEEGTRLLRNSYNEGDLAVFGALLDQFASDDDAYHSIGLSALNVITRAVERPKEAHTILLHLYENEPCSFCRGTAVKLLADADAVPDWMAREGRYDAEPSIAELFRPPTMEGR